MLLTSIPFFREVVVMSFRCEHCGFQNNEIQSAGTIRRMYNSSLSYTSLLTGTFIQRKALFTPHVSSREQTLIGQ